MRPIRYALNHEEIYHRPGETNRADHLYLRAVRPSVASSKVGYARDLSQVQEPLLESYTEIPPATRIAQRCTESTEGKMNSMDVLRTALFTVVASLLFAGLVFAENEEWFVRYPKTAAFMRQQPDFRFDRWTLQSAPFNRWIERLGLPPCAKMGERIDECLSIAEQRLEQYERMSSGLEQAMRDHGARESYDPVLRELARLRADVDQLKRAAHRGRKR